MSHDKAKSIPGNRTALSAPCVKNVNTKTNIKVGKPAGKGK